MKHLFLINPAAGKADGTYRFREEIRRVCRGLDYEIKVSQKPGDITAWARAAVEAGEEVRLYACGGDGTLNEAVNGAAGCPNAAVTHFPGGSGNDFIKCFSNPAAFTRLEELVAEPEEAVIDLICCNGDYALNVCSLGFDARIGTQIAGYKKLPLVTGPGAYIASALVNTVKGVHRPYRVEVDSQVVEGEKTMICVCNGQWYGGGFHPVPDADPTDGCLDVLLVKGVSRLTVLKVIGPYKEGRFREYPRLIQYFRTNRVKVTCREPEPINLDGELRTAREVEIFLAPGKLRFFYPKTACPAWKTPVGV